MGRCRGRWLFTRLRDALKGAVSRADVSLVVAAVLAVVEGDEDVVKGWCLRRWSVGGSWAFKEIWRSLALVVRARWNDTDAGGWLSGRGWRRRAGRMAIAGPSAAIEGCVRWCLAVVVMERARVAASESGGMTLAARCELADGRWAGRSGRRAWISCGHTAASAAGGAPLRPAFHQHLQGDGPGLRFAAAREPHPPTRRALHHGASLVHSPAKPSPVCRAALLSTHSTSNRAAIRCMRAAPHRLGQLRHASGCPYPIHPPLQQTGTRWVREHHHSTVSVDPATALSPVEPVSTPFHAPVVPGSWCDRALPSQLSRRVLLSYYSRVSQRHWLTFPAFGPMRRKCGCTDFLPTSSFHVCIIVRYQQSVLSQQPNLIL